MSRFKGSASWLGLTGLLVSGLGLAVPAGVAAPQVHKLRVADAGGVDLIDAAATSSTVARGLTASTMASSPESGMWHLPGAAEVRPAVGASGGAIGGNGSVPDVERRAVRFAGGESRIGAADAVGRPRGPVGEPLAVQLLRDEEVTPSRVPGESPRKPVSLPPAAQGRVPAGSARVHVLSTDRAFELGFNGLAFVVEPDSVMLAGEGALWARLEVDWSQLQANFGAEWQSRVGVVAFDPCVLTTESTCSSRQVAVPTVYNDMERQVLTVEVDLKSLRADIQAADGVIGTADVSDEPPVVSLSSTGGAGFALSASASSAYGNLGATSLQAAGKWSVSGNTGGFNWSYPIPATTVPGGPAPEMSLNYSSQSVDGLTADENTQGGLIGIGWSLPQAFIERRYRACASDGGGGGNGTFCWSGDNAVLSLNGQNGELSRDSSGVWRLENDPGWRIRRYGSTTESQGAEGVDSNGEYWVVTTQDGTQYWFGFGKEKGTGADTPGNAGSPGTDLKSVWTSPVVGNHASEPCNTLPGGGWCHQAYRWQLDRIVDSNGRVATYHYETHTNAFSRDWAAGSDPGYLVTSYTSGGQLVRVEYGKLFNDAAARLPETQVRFEYNWRCDPAVGNVPDATCTAAPTSTTGQNFPDIPADMICVPGSATCKAKAPTFFDWKVLRTVAVERLMTNSGVESLVVVDRVNLLPEWIDHDASDANNSLKLWLRKVWRTASQGTSAAESAPDIWFDSTVDSQLANRANPNQWNPSAIYHRVGVITDEIGGRTAVDYSPAEAACATKISGWDTNTLRCFVRWLSIDNPPSASGAATWNKYVVVSVSQHDMVRSQPAVVTTYSYDAAGMAWAHDDDPFATNTYWNEYRGYASVTVTTGTGADASKTTTNYFRGMHGDQLGLSSTKTVTLTSGLGIAYPDEEWLSGLIIQSTIYDNASEIATTFYDYIAQRPDINAAATNGGNARMGGVNKSRRVGLEWTSTRTKTGATSYLYDKNETRYDTDGRLNRSVRFGSMTLTGTSLTDVTTTDNTCTLTQYTAKATTDADRFIEGMPYRQDTLSDATCPAPSAANTLSRSITLFDSMAAAAKPVAGKPTTETVYAADTVSYATVTAYENDGFHATAASYGRPLTVTSPSTAVTTSVFTPVDGTGNRHLRRTVTTNGLNHEARTEFDAYGRVRRTEDANDHVVHHCYDVFGRATYAYFNIAQTVTCGAAGADLQFSYLSEVVNLTSPARATRSWMVETRALFATSTDPFRPAGVNQATFIETDSFFDGFGRTVQTQSVSPNSVVGNVKRVISVTAFSDDGRILRQMEPYSTGGEVGSTYVTPASINTNGQRHTAYGYDGLGRVIRAEQRVGTGTATTLVRANHTTYNGLTTTSHLATTSATPPAAPSTGSTVTTVNVLGEIVTVTERDNTSVSATGATATVHTNTTFTYTRLGQIDTRTDALNNVADHNYDWMGRVTSGFDPSAGARSYEYDNGGRIKCATDARNQRIYKRYDILNRTLSEWLLPSSVACPANGATPPANSKQLASFGYDNGTGAKGATTSAVAYDQTTGAQTVVATVDPTAGFDTFGRLRKYKIEVLAANDPAISSDDHLDDPVTFETNFTRDGGVHQTIYPTVNGHWWPQETVTATFNALGNQLSTSSTWEATPGVSATYVAQTSFDDTGRLQQSKLGHHPPLPGTASMIADFIYQTNNGRLASLKATRVASGGSSIEAIDQYIYDTVGNPTEVKHNPDNADYAYSDCYTYDTRQRLAAARTTVLNGCAGTTLAPATAAPYNDVYRYDQLHRFVRNGASPVTAARTYTSGYSGITGCQSFGTAPVGSKPYAVASITAQGTTPAMSFTYDCNGSTLTSTGSTSDTYSWTAYNRLGAVARGGSTVERNIYDAAGKRVLRIDTVGTVTTKTVLLGNLEYRWVHDSTDGSSATTQMRVYGPVQRGFDGEIAYIATDPKRTITTALTVNGEVNRTMYKPYGGIRAGTTNNGKGFLGLTHDPTTGLNHLTNRHQNPTTGLFISVDPLVSTTSHPYSYANDNPISLSDPSGLCGWLVIDCIDDVFDEAAEVIDEVADVGYYGTPLHLIDVATGGDVGKDFHEGLTDGLITPIAAIGDGKETVQGAWNAASSCATSGMLPDACVQQMLIENSKQTISENGWSYWLGDMTSNVVPVPPVIAASKAATAVSKVTRSIPDMPRLSPGGVRVKSSKAAKGNKNWTPALQAKYPGVTVDDYGWVDFGQHVKASYVVEEATGKVAPDAAKIQKLYNYTIPKGHTWHHAPDGKTLQVVPSELHKAWTHVGGAAMIRRGLVTYS